MSITIYTKPNHKGANGMFDPNSVKAVFVVSRFHPDLNKLQSIFVFMNNDGKSNFNLLDKREKFTIGSIKNNNRHFYLLAFTEKMRDLKIIEGSVIDTNDKTLYSGLLVLKYPACFYVHMVVCLIIIVLLVAFIVYLKLTHQ